MLVQKQHLSNKTVIGTPQIVVFVGVGPISLVDGVGSSDSLDDSFIKRTRRSGECSGWKGSKD